MKTRSLAIHALSTLLLAAILCVPNALYAQQITGRIVGIISDTSGAAVPRAEVVIANAGTGITFQTASNDQGYYVVPALPSGSYSIRVEVAGFKKLDRSGINLEGNQTARVDVVLQVGDTSDTVTVKAEAPLINSENVDMGTRYYRNQITDLPLMNGAARNIEDFVHFGAGTTEAQGKGANSVAINGSRNVPPITLLDGTDIGVGDTANSYQVRPQVENVQEIQIQRGTYSSETGGMGATIITTLSGTNQYHGSAYGFFSNQDLMARNFFAAQSPGESHVRDWGGTIGGPIIKNRTFGAYTYDRYSSKGPAINISTVPTAALRSGDFTGIGTVYDPNSTRPNPDGPGVIRSAFPGDRIPQDRMDPVSLKLMAYFPDANLPGLVNNYTNEKVAGSYQPFAWKQSIRLDQVVTSRNHLFARWQYNDDDNDKFVFYPNPANPTFTTFVGNGHVGTVGDTHTFSPRAVNEFRAGFVRYAGCFCARDIQSDADYAGQVGLKGVAGNFFPIIRVTGLVGMGLGLQYGDQSRIYQENTQFSDNLTYIRGSHTLKFGGALKKDRYNNYKDGHPEGDFSFSGMFTNQPSVAGGALGFADFLLGLSSKVDITSTAAFAFRKPQWSLFAEDNYKWRPNVTFTLGLRLDTDRGTTEVYNRMSNLSPTAINPITNTPGAIIFAGKDSPRSFVDPTYSLSPRVGIAYSLNPKTVFRLGGSINYWQNPINAERNNQNLGFVSTLSLVTSDQVTPALRLQDGAPPLPALKQTGDIGNNNNVSYVPRDAPMPVLYQWSFSIQRQIPGSMVIEAAYVGSRGVDNWFYRNINQVPPELRGPGNMQPLRPFPAFKGITYKVSDGASKYNSMQLTLTKRLSHGLSFGANYTLSKAMDNSSWTSSGGNGSDAQFQELNNLALEWAVSESDIPQVFNLYGTYEVPHFARGGGLGRYLLRGWEVGYIARLNSGLPLNLGTSINQTAALAGTPRPDRLADGRLSGSQQTTNSWFDVSAFALPAPYMFGTAGRNILRAPGFANLDASVFKNTYIKTPLNESTNIQFRAEAASVLNHPVFGAPNVTIGSAAAGTITSASGSRVITLGLRFVF